LKWKDRNRSCRELHPAHSCNLRA